MASSDTGRISAATLPATIVPLSAEEAEARLVELAGLLHACVHAGASIGFILPHPLAEAEAFWRDKVFPGLRSGGLDVLIATVGERLVGAVQLDCDTPRNQPHRAELRKLLVHPQFRRRGIARALVMAIEARALSRGRRLVTLDTRTGDAAEPLYAGLGYTTAGIIPGYCRDPFADTLDATTIMFKPL